MFIDLRVLELLSSKLCHDLVSPVSAINNGVELIEEIGGDVVDEAMKLIGNSARQAAHRLKLYRIAYGRAGSEANLSLRDSRQIAAQYLEGTKMTFVWPEGVLNDAIEDCCGALKVLLNLIVMAEETLAYGGTITIVPSQVDTANLCHIEVVGRNAQLSENVENALAAKISVEEITPRTIQAYYTGKVAEHYGLKISYSQPTSDRLDVTLSRTSV